MKHKAWERKKAYRRWIKEQARKGRIPSPDGGWHAAKDTDANDRCFLAGHRVDRA